MKKTIPAKSFIYPLPVLIVGSYDENNNPNAMNAAWGTTCDTAQVSLYLSSGHKSTANILKNKAFTVAIADEKNIGPADYVGLVSGNSEPNKIAKAGWTVTPSKTVNAPVIDQLPLTMECRLISYDNESENLIGEVVSVTVDDSILDKNGKIDATKLRPICYDTANHGYYALGAKVGQAFSDGKELK